MYPLYFINPTSITAIKLKTTCSNLGHSLPVGLETFTTMALASIVILHLGLAHLVCGS